MSNLSEISFHLGEQGEDLAKRYPNKVDINRQPAGLDFYKFDWSTSTAGTVKIDHGKHSFKIENVLSFTGTQDSSYKSEGIVGAIVYSGITAADSIPHNEARLKTAEILGKITQAGWKMLISNEVPRLRGKDTVDYLLTSNKYITLDPAYIPTLDEWMRLKDLTTWSFYVDHVFLEVNISRDDALTDPAKPGAYLLGFKFKSEAEYYRGFVDGDDRKNWKVAVPGELAKMAVSRITAEAAIRLKGIKIDETYQDAPFPDLRGK